MVHCREEISSVIVLPGCSCSARSLVPEWVHESVTEENPADNSTSVHISMINSLFVTSGNYVLEFEIWSAGQCGGFRVQTIDVIHNPNPNPLIPALCIWCVYDSLLCLPVVFRFILVFSCLVLSVFSTIPAHQDFSSYCLLILVRNWTTINHPKNHFLSADWQRMFLS